MWYYNEGHTYDVGLRKYFMFISHELLILGREPDVFAIRGYLDRGRWTLGGCSDKHQAAKRVKIGILLR